MEQFDELLQQKDELIAEQSEGALSKAQYIMLMDFTKLEEKIIVNSREDICFVFKDGTEVKTK
jgi:hypothetical protein